MIQKRLCRLTLRVEKLPFLQEHLDVPEQCLPPALARHGRCQPPAVEIGQPPVEAVAVLGGFIARVDNVVRHARSPEIVLMRASGAYSQNAPRGDLLPITIVSHFSPTACQCRAAP